MSKKFAALFLIGMILAMAGCTGQNSGTPTAVPAGTVSPTGVAAPTVDPSLPQNATSDNESTPELDLPLPPDIEDL